MLIIVMNPEVKTTDIGFVLQEVEALGLKPHLSRENDRTLIGVTGEFTPELQGRLEGLQGVESVIPTKQPFKLVSREFKKESTKVLVGDVEVGGKAVVVMAGPCAVENRDQLFSVAKAVKACGVRILRGGAFKPRTSPYSFQGLGKEGLELLDEVRKAFGLFVVTEVLSENDIELVASHADMLQIGARNMQNFSLLQEAGKSRKPVLLKRGMMSTLEELFMAAEYIVSGGNGQVILCERGIRTFEKYTRNTLDLAAVPIIQKYTHLPVVVDPSHAAGRRDLVASLAKGAVAAGADGLLIEIHPEPEKALSDGPQSLTLPLFQQVMAELGKVAQAVGRQLS